MPSFTFAATANAVAIAGATPVFADIEPATFCLDPDAVAAAVTSRTAAIMPVHLYGHPAHLGGLADVAERHGLLLLEDAAQAHAASYDGTPGGRARRRRRVQLLRHQEHDHRRGRAWSCAATRTTARPVRLLRNQGMEQRYRNEIAGLNNRMTDLAAAMGRVQLRRLAGWNEERRAVAATTTSSWPAWSHPVVAPKAEPVWHQYTVRATDRDALAARLDASGIDSAVYYPVPTHRLPAYDLDLDLPETERAAREVLSLPMRPGLTDDEVARVVAAVNEESEPWLTSRARARRVRPDGAPPRPGAEHARRGRAGRHRRPGPAHRPRPAST